MDHQHPALHILDLLQARLQRIKYVLHGDNLSASQSTESTQFTEATDISKSPSTPVAQRLEKLQQSLSTLRSSSTAVSDLLDLHDKTLPPKSLRNTLATPDQSTIPDQSTLTALVVSNAPLYQSVASQLTSISDMPIPPASASVELVSQLPRIRRLALTGARQEAQVLALVRESARVVARWQTVGVLGLGECWAEWHERLMRAERVVRQAETRLAQDAAEM